MVGFKMEIHKCTPPPISILKKSLAVSRMEGQAHTITVEQQISEFRVYSYVRYKLGQVEVKKGLAWKRDKRPKSPIGSSPRRKSIGFWITSSIFSKPVRYWIRWSKYRETRVLVINVHQCTLGHRPMHWLPRSIKSVSCVAGETKLKWVQVVRVSDHLLTLNGILIHLVQKKGVPEAIFGTRAWRFNKPEEDDRYSLGWKQNSPIYTQYYFHPLHQSFIN